MTYRKTRDRSPLTDNIVRNTFKAIQRLHCIDLALKNFTCGGPILVSVLYDVQYLTDPVHNRTAICLKEIRAC